MDTAVSDEIHLGRECRAVKGAPPGPLAGIRDLTVIEKRGMNRKGKGKLRALSDFAVH